jgi:hypothetical protein
MAQAYPENRQITHSLPHHYGPKTDRRIWAVMSHNAELVGYGCTLRHQQLSGWQSVSQKPIRRTATGPNKIRI